MIKLSLRIVAVFFIVSVAALAILGAAGVILNFIGD